MNEMNTHLVAHSEGSIAVQELVTYDLAITYG